MWIGLQPVDPSGAAPRHLSPKAPQPQGTSAPWHPVMFFYYDGKKDCRVQEWRQAAAERRIWAGLDRHEALQHRSSHTVPYVTHACVHTCMHTRTLAGSKKAGEGVGTGACACRSVPKITFCLHAHAHTPLYEHEYIWKLQVRAGMHSCMHAWMRWCLGA